jgi:uncharacterized protein (TIGR02266 family)
MGRKRIVLADDVELFLMMENTFFNREEFEMITVRGGQELIRIVRASGPELIFMDLQMPDMSGDECCRILKSDEASSNVPLVIVSPCHEKETLDRCRSAGCDDIVTKPINRQDFMNISRKYLNITERADMRFPVRIEVSFGVISGAIHSGCSIDLNTGGMFIATDHLYRSGTLLHVDFILPGAGRQVRCPVEVAWVNGPEERRKPRLPNGMGVRFMGLGAAELEVIRACMEEGKSGTER